MGVRPVILLRRTGHRNGDGPCNPLINQFMNVKFRASQWPLALILLQLIPFPTLAQTTAFSYQGRLNATAGPANGLYDFQFRLFDAPANGGQQGSTVLTNSVPVTNGLFTVALDFGNTVFSGP